MTGPLVWDIAPPADKRLNLSRATIGEAAMRIADAEGEAAVTMRRVAAELGASTPMTLYRYVGSKDGIVDLMIDGAFADIGLPDTHPGDWREAMTMLAEHTRAALRKHPWFTSLSHQRPPFGPAALRHNEWSLAALDPASLRVETAMTVAGMVFGYAAAYAQNEAEEARMRRRVGVSTDAELRATASGHLDRITTDGRYPHLAEWIARAREDDADAQFQLGLDCLLDGIESRVIKPGGRMAAR